MTALPTNFIVADTDIQPIPNDSGVIPAPAAKTANAVGATVPPPAAKTANAVGATVPPFALNHARILYQNEFLNGSATGSPTGSNALKPNTYETWRWAATTSTTVFNLPANRDIDTVCLGGHNIGSSGGGDVKVYWDDDLTGGLTLIETKTIAPGDPDTPIMFHFGTTYNARRIQVDVVSPNTDTKYVAYVSGGVALQMQRPFFGGHTPINDGDVTEYYNARTQSGNIVGREIRRKGFETQCSWKNIDDTWYRTYFSPFKQIAKTFPFFMAWNLLEYPDDVGFCRVVEDMRAPYSGVLALRSIDFTILGV